MKLKNKKTGEIKDFIIHKDKIQTANAIDYWEYDSLANLCEEWEDVPEPKMYWYLTGKGTISCIEDENTDFDNAHKCIGNYFSSEEEAEQAIEKLKAWKRLKDKGFSFEGYDDGYKHDFNSGHIEFYVENDGGVLKDLDLLFGGE